MSWRVGLARKIVWFLMSLLRTFKGLFSRKQNADSEQPRSMVIMQREAHQFSEEELRAAAERGWSKRFDGNEDPMFFVSANHPALTVVKAGPHIIRVISAPGRYSDNDQYALSQLRKPEQKKAWLEHHACVFLELFNDLSSTSQRVSDADAYASLATLALQLGDPNCAAIYVPILNIMMPNDGTAEEGLRLLISKELPLHH
jgi:hypothetical protein